MYLSLHRFKYFQSWINTEYIGKASFVTGLVFVIYLDKECDAYSKVCGKEHWDGLNYKQEEIKHDNVTLYHCRDVRCSDLPICRSTREASQTVQKCSDVCGNLLWIQYAVGGYRTNRLSGHIRTEITHKNLLASLL